MELTILGRNGPYPAPNGATSGYLIKEKNTRLILELGAGTLSRLLTFDKIENIQGIFISHFHYDHTSDLFVLSYLASQLGLKIRIYTAVEDTPYSNFILNQKVFDVIDIKNIKELKIGDFNCRFVKTEHSVQNHAIIIQGLKKIAYTGDSIYCDAIFSLFNNVDAVLGDFANKPGFKGSHMTIEDAISLHKKTNVKIYVTHLDPRFDPSIAISKKDESKIIIVKENATYII